MYCLEPEQLTDDALTDRVRVYQRRYGHRYSVDDVSTAWVALRATECRARSCLDLGCGLGSVLLMLADRIPMARAVGIEAQAISYALAERNIERNRLARRVSAQFGDLRDRALLDRTLQAEAAFGREFGFDVVTGTPPYKPVGTASLSPDPQRAYARVELRGGVEAYLNAAAHVLEPEGLFVMCAQREQELRVVAGARAAQLRGIYRLDVIPRLEHKERLFSVHVFVREQASAELAATVVRRLRADGNGNAANGAGDGHGAMTWPATDRLVLRDESGARTRSAHELRAYFGLSIEERELSSMGSLVP